MKFLRRLIARLLGARFARAMALLDIALPVVEAIAARTPNRTDDEIVALIKECRLALPTRMKELSANLRAAALQSAALELLRRRMELLGISEASESVLRLAIEMAVSRFKAAREAEG